MNRRNKSFTYCFDQFGEAFRIHFDLLVIVRPIRMRAVGFHFPDDSDILFGIDFGIFA